MERKDIVCIFCGHLNKGLDLDETNGWVECEHCGHDFAPGECLDKVRQSTYSVMSPVDFIMLQLKDNKKDRIS